ncbi:hypothetical protein [Mycobacterium talmoniae]|uniref:Uncharacterized protein n=1 Tax=Mycobacterium talmoniae TaxID=1858794 RepID=A0A1S1NEB6_9MYCO|nr:hypothetical protein [Mycobacterium talmoniae]OHU98193.1 hypothetical protein BKN37_21035 [Mycobacterium talmoniae]
MYVASSGEQADAAQYATVVHDMYVTGQRARNVFHDALQAYGLLAQFTDKIAHVDHLLSILAAAVQTSC